MKTTYTEQEFNKAKNELENALYMAHECADKLVKMMYREEASIFKQVFSKNSTSEILNEARIREQQVNNDAARFTNIRDAILSASDIFFDE